MQESGRSARDARASEHISFPKYSPMLSTREYGGVRTRCGRGGKRDVTTRGENGEQSVLRPTLLDSVKKVWSQRALIQPTWHNGYNIPKSCVPRACSVLVRSSEFSVGHCHRV